MQIPHEIKKAFDTLLQTPAFLQSIAEYTQSALQTVYGLPQSQQIQTPATYLLVITNFIQNGHSIQHIISAFPQSCRAKVKVIFQSFDKNEEITRIDNSVFGNLSDVEWEMLIENGRQVWQIRLYCQEKTEPLKLKLNYEQLSVLSFQVGQAMSHLMNIAK